MEEEQRQEDSVIMKDDGVDGSVLATVDRSSPWLERKDTMVPAEIAPVRKRKVEADSKDNGMDTKWKKEDTLMVVAAVAVKHSVPQLYSWDIRSGSFRVLGVHEPVVTLRLFRVILRLDVPPFVVEVPQRTMLSMDADYPRMNDPVVH